MWKETFPLTWRDSLTPWSSHTLPSSVFRFLFSVPSHPPSHHLSQGLSICHTPVCQGPISARLQMSFHGEKMEFVCGKSTVLPAVFEKVFFPFFCLRHMFEAIVSPSRCLRLLGIDPSALGHRKSSLTAVCSCFPSRAVIVSPLKRQEKAQDSFHHCRLSCWLPILKFPIWFKFLMPSQKAEPPLC